MADNSLPSLNVNFTLSQIPEIKSLISKKSTAVADMALLCCDMSFAFHEMNKKSELVERWCKLAKQFM